MNPSQHGNTDETSHKSNKDQEINIYTLLQGKTYASKKFVDRIQLQINTRLGQLAQGERYTSRQLCGKEFWGTLDKEERILAGRCVAHLAIMNLLPLAYVGRTSGNALLYQLK